MYRKQIIKPSRQRSDYTCKNITCKGNFKENMKLSRHNLHVHACMTGHRLSLVPSPHAVRVSSSSSILPWEVIIHYEGHDTSEVCVGLQPALRMMIHHTSQVFMAPETEESRSNQLELCQRILRFYQELVMTWILDHNSWYGTCTLYMVWDSFFSQ